MLHLNKMAMQWYVAGIGILLLIQLVQTLESTRCTFNSMCSCNTNIDTQKVSDISCVSVPFYNFPNIPDTISISHMEVQGSSIMSLERNSFPANVQIQSLTIANNKLQSIADKSFSSLEKTLSSLDLSYNNLNAIPFSAMQELKNLQWLNLYGNSINSITGDWKNVKNTLANLFLGGNDIISLSEDLNHVLSTSDLRQFKSLVWLNLDSNHIRILQRYSVPTALQTLSVSHNLLQKMPDDLLTDLQHLQWLYLRDNHITALSKFTFPKRIRLEKIDLSENSIRNLQRNPFNNSLYVRDLNLAFNSIRNILADSFQGLDCGRIIFSHNEIETVDILAFQGLNETLEYLDFDHNHLSRIPPALNQLTQLKYLYLSSNLISTVNKHAFSEFSTKLKALSLSGNRLINIPKDALENCTELSYLNIGYNEIYEILPEDFQWANNLKTLLLRNNRLIHLKEKIFTGLKSLKELSLSFNPLRYVDTNAFEGLQNLESLEISFSLDWEEFPQDILKPLTNLQWLTMDNNNFKTITDHGLSDLTQLKYINLEGNVLDNIPVQLFKSTVHISLTDIRLSNNYLELIQSNTFDSLTNLRTVVLTGNKISSIQKNSFAKLTNLSTLSLADNTINHISTQAFSNLPNFNNLDLHSNRLTEFSFKVFINVSNLTPLILNVSKNFISTCESDNKIVNIEIFDLSYNNILYVPTCLEHISALKKLYLNFNKISSLEHNVLMHHTSLELLSLTKNNISTVNKQAFFGLQNLQILNLAFNHIAVIHSNQFSNMLRLRILNLGHNKVTYLPKNAFSGTIIEKLDISYNSFSVVPSATLSEVGHTLRYLALRANNIEHVDSTTFLEISNLQYLDFTNNKLTILPDNVFTSLGLLQKLDLSTNIFRANFKEMFHYAQSLNELRLCNIGITYLPNLPLPNLVFLNISYNNVESISKSSMQELRQLKYLYLNHNKLVAVPAHIWTYLPKLKILDLSNNPIKEISASSFVGLENLQTLIINNLSQIRKFDSASIMQLSLLSSLTMQTWPALDNFRPQLCFLFANLTRLRILKINIKEAMLNEQLRCVTSHKLKFLQITGENLKYIHRDAFTKFMRNPEISIQITNTQIEELPAGLFSGLDKVAHFTIDLRNNMLNYLSPDIFYSNATTWKNIGTTLISGGLLISSNPWKCGCHLAWLGHWQRRWVRESLQAHTASVTTLSRFYEQLKEATCTNVRTGKRVPIVNLSADDLSCHASALSTANTNTTNTTLSFWIIFKLYVLLIVIKFGLYDSKFC